LLQCYYRQRREGGGGWRGMRWRRKRGEEEKGVSHSPPQDMKSSRKLSDSVEINIEQQ